MIVADRDENAPLPAVSDPRRHREEEMSESSRQAGG